jgi:copper(I)-binding protein
VVGVGDGNTATMYFTIDDPTAEPVSLVSITAKTTVSLDPGGTHVMLMNVGTLKPGDRVPTTFRFRDGQTVSVSVPVRSGDVPGGS